MGGGVGGVVFVCTLLLTYIHIYHLPMWGWGDGEVWLYPAFDIYFICLQKIVRTG